MINCVDEIIVINCSQEIDCDILINCVEGIDCDKLFRGN